MAKAPKVYTRLSGRGRRQGEGFFTSSRSGYSLWMGPDHLLLVERTGYTENYKRFYFHDIQAVTIRRTSTSTVFNSVTGGLALLFAFFGVLAAREIRIFLWIIASPLALFCLINFFRGPTCVTYLQTAVQTEQLPPLNRISTTRKGLAALRVRLQEAQGQMAPDDLKAQWLDGIMREAQPPPGP